VKTETEKAFPPDSSANPDGENGSLELHFGQVWLVRIGMVVLLTGLVFLGNLAYQHIVPMLGPGGKLAAISLAGVALCTIGLSLERRRESLRNYARVLIAGGCAALYYTAYAAHFVAALRIIDNPVAGGALLLLLAGGIVWFAHRKKSESLALLALLLTYYVSSINPAGAFTLYSSLLLTASAVYLLVRSRWMRVSVLSLAGSYASYSWWRFFQNGIGSNLEIQVLFLSGYWAIFTTGGLLAARTAFIKGGRASFFSANNAAFFILTAYEFVTFHRSHFWLFAFIFGTTLLGLSILARKVLAPEEQTEAPLFVQGLGLCTVGLAFELSAPELSIALAAQSLLLLGASRGKANIRFSASWLSMLGAAGLAFYNLWPPQPHAALAGGIVAPVLIFHGWWIQRRMKGAYEEVPLPLAISGMAVLLGAASLYVSEGCAESVPWLALGAVLLSAIGALLRFRELAAVAQPLLPLAVAMWITSGIVGGIAPLGVLGAGVLLAQWWSRQRRLPFAAAETWLLEACAAFSASVTGALWAQSTWTHPGLMAISSALAVLWVALALVMRNGMLAASGLIFSALSVIRFVIDFDVAPWTVALFPALGLINLAWMTRWADRLGARVALAAKMARPYFIGAALAMLMAWTFQHIPDYWLVLCFVATASACALASIWQPMFAVPAVLLAVLSGTQLFFRFRVEPTLPHLAAILLFPASCRIARMFTKPDALHKAAPTLAWITVSFLALWLHRANGHYHWQLSHTIIWALFAPVLFTGGFLLREKAYRQGGMWILLLGIGNLFGRDVWSFDPVSRIVSFMVLGVVLLAMGYFYNRFAETLRRWL
jgi:uncharacterized membrane protein